MGDSVEGLFPKYFWVQQSGNNVPNFCVALQEPCLLFYCFVFNRYNNPNTKVLVFQADDLPLGQSVNFTYKATTKSALPPSIFVSSLVYLAYTTLPYNLSPREGRKYHKNSDQVKFLQIVTVYLRCFSFFKKKLGKATISNVDNS